MCFRCVNGFIYSILYTPVTMYYVLPCSQEPVVNTEESFEVKGCSDGAALDARCSWSVSTCCDSLLSCSIFSCSRTAEEGASAPYDIAVSLFSGAERTFCMTATEHNNVTSQTSVWDKCHKCNIDLSYLLFMPRVLNPHPQTLTYTGYLQMYDPSHCQNRLLAVSHKDLDCTHHPPLNTHTKSCSLKYSNGANPMHFSLCNMYSCL